MELSFRGRTIRMERELSSLDKLALKFAKKLQKPGIRYAIVSGYVAIVFGRSRSSEDIDVLVEKLDWPKFKKFYASLMGEFECVNAESAETAFDYLSSGIAVRFSAPMKFVPNVEMKFAEHDLQHLSINKRLKLEMGGGNSLYIGPMEPQLAYKLMLGTDQDFEDALYLYNIFKKRLDRNLLTNAARKLGVEGRLPELERYHEKEKQGKE